MDEKQRTATLTEEGIARAEKMLNVDNLYDPSNMEILHCVNQALVAHKLYHLDVEYMIKDDEVVIVDEFTGRVMPGRRWSDGLHQAIEAKEGVKIQQENQTLATITFQNYFRLYEKLAGMTGTADTEAAEFDKIYKLDVVVIPPNRPLGRTDNPDLVYKTEKEKWEAAADEIEELHEKGQPVLVGTVSIEKSERMSALLKRRGVTARGAQRQVPREGGGDRGAGGPQGGRDHRHQHGGPRHRHPAGRQPGGLRPRPRPTRRPSPRSTPGTWPISWRPSPASTTRWWASAACTSSARSATSPAASTTSSAAAPGARATRAPPGSTSPSRTTSCASSAATA